MSKLLELFNFKKEAKNLIYDPCCNNCLNCKIEYLNGISGTIEGIDCILDKGNIGETYLIGSQSEKKNIDIVNMICDYFNDIAIDEDNFSYHSLIHFVEDRPGHDFRYAIDNSKIKNKLGWKPKYSFKGALSKTIEWYIENKVWYENILKRNKMERLGLIKK